MLSKTVNNETLGHAGQDYQAVSQLNSDEACLETMRGIIKEYVIYCHQHMNDNSMKQSFKNRYEEWRQTLRDETLRAFTAFELMEKLYRQEYLIRD